MIRTGGATRALWAEAALALALCMGPSCTAKVREQPAAMAPPPPEVLPQKPVPARRPMAATPPPPPPVAAAAPPTRALDAGIVDTLNGDPRGLRREDLNRALSGLVPSLAGCFQSGGATGGSVGLAFDADSTGRAQNVRVTGAEPEAQRCVTSTLAALRLPAFEGKSVPVELPLAIHRPAAVPSATTATTPLPTPAPIPVGIPTTPPRSTGLPTTPPTGAGQQPNVFIKP